MIELTPELAAGLDVAAMAARLREIALRVLPRMYRPEQRSFAFRLRATPDGTVLEGDSRRYTATVLIGLAGESELAIGQALVGQSRREVCDRLLDALQDMADPGEVALTLWAARALGHARAELALRRLRQMQLDRRAGTTVELAWSLSALCVPGEAPTDRPLADALARRLLASFSPETGLFAHWVDGSQRPWLRGHVACFADAVYPTQALSYHARASGDERSRQACRRCAETMVALQGPAGQWWWHFDVRTGRVVEGYPVYAVHQDSMAPMALQAASAATGVDHGRAIAAGLAWLEHAPEIDGSLIDAERDVIWRKVARREPRKLSRGLQALSTRLVPGLRMPVGALLRPVAIDFESRPYHMGWILHAWPAGAGRKEKGSA